MKRKKLTEAIGVVTYPIGLALFGWANLVFFPGEKYKLNKVEWAMLAIFAMPLATLFHGGLLLWGINARLGWTGEYAVFTGVFMDLIMAVALGGYVLFFPNMVKHIYALRPWAVEHDVESETADVRLPTPEDWVALEKQFLTELIPAIKSGWSPDAASVHWSMVASQVQAHGSLLDDETIHALCRRLFGVDGNDGVRPKDIFAKFNIKTVAPIGGDDARAIGATV